MSVARTLTAEQVSVHDRQRELGVASEQVLADLFRRSYPPRSLVLDAGGGSGVAVPALRAAGLRPVLLDLAPAMIAAAAAHRIPMLRADLRMIPLRAESVHGVHAAYVLPNIAEWREVGAEFARVLMPGGVALIAFGAPPVDQVVSRLARRHFASLREAGAIRVGMPAEDTGMGSVEDAQLGLASVGLVPEGEHELHGEQTRSLRELVYQWSRNPFAVDGSPTVLAAAEDATLRWASREVGEVDLPRIIQVRSILHEFVRS